MGNFSLGLSNERDALLTAFGKTTLQDRYLLTGETFQEMFARVASAYADDEAHAQRMYDYISQHWFMPATPTLSNGGTHRGLPISCYLNNVSDDMGDIAAKWTENVWLGANGGGIGTCWSDLRGVGEQVRGRGHSSGVIPFMHVMDSLTLAVSQGSLRRGAAAVYLDISHPEIEEFIDLRRPTGDLNRKSLNLHHGVVIPDAFMECVRSGSQWTLVDPHKQREVKKVSARELWTRILETRVATGEPYLLFIDTVNRAMPMHQRVLGLKVRQSNLCAEITLPTGKDHLGHDRTAVCCLGSVNAEHWDKWSKVPGFVEDCLRFLDNVLQAFLDLTEGKVGFDNARYSAYRERSVGLGVMGFHSALQNRGVPFESALAFSFNRQLFKHLREQADAASRTLALEKGACPDAKEVGVQERFSCKLSLAPTASISIVAGGCSPTVEPIPGCVFTHKTLSGSFQVRNAALEALLKDIGKNTDEVWDAILQNEGSVQRLPFLSDHQKLVFRTAFEIDPRWIVQMAAERAPFVCQSQSINLFLPSDVEKFDLHMLHFRAWETGVKSLYYLRSKSVQRSGFVGGVEEENTTERKEVRLRSDYEECLACQ